MPYKRVLIFFQKNCKFFLFMLFKTVVFATKNARFSALFFSVNDVLHAGYKNVSKPFYSPLTFIGIYKQKKDLL